MCANRLLQDPRPRRSQSYLFRLGYQKGIPQAGAPVPSRQEPLLTHPDKNGYDGADDAFKLVSKAFQVLSDPDKKKKYDQFGGDPDARFDPRAHASANGGGGASPFGNGFARRGGFEEEMTPEELFRQFFGGAFGGPFGMYSLIQPDSSACDKWNRSTKD